MTSWSDGPSGIPIRVFSVPHPIPGPSLMPNVTSPIMPASTRGMAAPRLRTASPHGGYWSLRQEVDDALSKRVVKHNLSVAESYPALASLIEARKNKRMHAVEPESLAMYAPFEGTQEARRAAAMALAVAAGVESTPDPAQVIVTNGATAAIEAVAMATCDVGDAVLLPTPRYPSLALDVGARAGVTAKYVDDLTPTALRRAVDEDSDGGSVRAILFTSPDNPTGRWRSREELDAIMEVAHERGLYVIWDAVYAATSSAPDRGAVPPLDDPHVITIYSASKDFGLSGWRIGVMHTSNADVFNALMVGARFTCASTLAQSAFANLVGDDMCDLRAYFEDAAITLKSRRDIAHAALVDAGVPPQPEHLYPHAGPLSLVHLPLPQDADGGIALWRAILRKGVAVVPGTTCGAPSDHVRVCWGCAASDADAVDAASRIAAAWLECKCG